MAIPTFMIHVLVHTVSILISQYFHYTYEFAQEH